MTQLMLEEKLFQMLVAAAHILTVSFGKASSSSSSFLLSFLLETLGGGTNLSISMQSSKKYSGEQHSSQVNVITKTLKKSFTDLQKFRHEKMFFC